MMRDPEIEVPEDDQEEDELEMKFTAIKLDRMHDGSQTGEESEEEGHITPLRKTRKRKYTPTDGEESSEEQRRKRTASPRVFSALRGND